MVQEVITHIRALRDKANIGLNIKSNVRIDSDHHAPLYQEHEDVIKRLARLEMLHIENRKPEMNNESLSSYFEDTLVQLEASAVDWKEEVEKLNKKLQKEESFLSKSQKKLQNEQFLSKAPDQVVADLREKVISKERLIDALHQQISELENRY